MSVPGRILMKWSPRVGGGLLVGGTLFVFVVCAAGRAQPPRDAATRTVQGKVDRLTTAPRGEVDGAVLDDGTWLHWPPHMQDRFTDVVKRGDRVRAIGRTETGPMGDEHFEIRSVTNLRTDARAENQDFDNGRPLPRRPGKKAGKGRRGPRDEEPRTVTGTVREFTTAPRGEIDGMMLSDGTEVHWPPHLGEQLKGFLARKDRVRVSGWLHTTPRGDVHLRAGTITNLRTDKSITLDDRAPVPGAGAAPNVERRLRELEDKLDRLTRMVERLRREK